MGLVILVRYLVSLILGLVLLKVNNKNVNEEVNTRKKQALVFLRSLIFFAGFWTIIMGIPFLPTAITALIQNTCGFIAAILGYLVLSDLLYPSEIFFIIIGYCGVALMILGKPQEDAEFNEESRYLFGVFCIFFSSLCLASVITLSRILNDVHFAAL